MLSYVHDKKSFRRVFIKYYIISRAGGLDRRGSLRPPSRLRPVCASERSVGVRAALAVRAVAGGERV